MYYHKSSIQLPTLNSMSRTWVKSEWKVISNKHLEKYKFSSHLREKIVFSCQFVDVLIPFVGW